MSLNQLQLRFWQKFVGMRLLSPSEITFLSNIISAVQYLSKVKSNSLQYVNFLQNFVYYCSLIFLIRGHFTMRVLKYALSALILVGSMVSAAVAETWHMPTPYPITSFHTMNIQQFATDVEKATGGKLKIEVHSAGSLFKHADIKNAVRSGQVPIGEFLLSRLANENSLFEVDSLPFLATDYFQAAQLWRASKPYVKELLAREGLVVLFSVPWPPQALYTSKPVETVDDLRGVKLRAYNKAQEHLAQLAGAVPTQVEVPDIPQAFATGRVQAMITSPSTGANTRAWEFVSHYYNTQAWLPKNIVVVSKKILSRLDRDTRLEVLKAADAAEQRGWSMSMEETEAKVAVLRNNGLQVADPSPALAEGLQQIGEVMAKEWLERSGRRGEALLSRYRNAERAEGAESAELAER